MNKLRVLLSAGTILSLVAGTAHASPLVVKGRFTQVGHGELIGDANDVLIYGQTGLLVDAATQHRTAVAEPGCSPTSSSWFVAFAETST